MNLNFNKNVTGFPCRISKSAETSLGLRPFQIYSAQITNPIKKEASNLSLYPDTFVSSMTGT